MLIAISQGNEKSQFGDYRDILVAFLDFFNLFCNVIIRKSFHIKNRKQSLYKTYL